MWTVFSNHPGNPSLGLCHCSCQDKDAFGVITAALERIPQDDSHPLDEKRLLEGVFKAFVKSAIKGVPCQRIVPETAEVISGTYSIDPNLNTLTFTTDPYAAPTVETEEVTIDITRIGAIELASDDREEAWCINLPFNKYLFPPIAIMQYQKQPLRIESKLDLDLNFDLTADGSDIIGIHDDLPAACLVDRKRKLTGDDLMILVIGSRSEAEKFGTCMRILCYYSNPTLE